MSQLKKEGEIKIPKPPIKDGTKSVILWLISYRTKEIVILVLLILVLILTFSVFSLSISRNEDGKLGIDKVEVKPIDTKINVNAGK